MDTAQAGVGVMVKLKGSELEQAYRNLLLENQVLAEGNERLHERIARLESGLEESPSARQLIRAQRNALADRSHRLRELDYDNKKLRRNKKKLLEENRRLSDLLARKVQEMKPMARKLKSDRQEMEQMQAALAEKSRELARLQDKYYQLLARIEPDAPDLPDSVVNGKF